MKSARRWFGTRLIAVAFVSLVGIGSFVGASAAVRKSAASPQFPPGWSVSGTPVASLSSAQLSSIQGGLERAADRFGISIADLSGVRLVANTSAGPVYAIPGTRGLCVVILASDGPGVSCDDPSVDGGTNVSIFSANQDQTYLAGAGVNLKGSSLTVRLKDGSSVEPTVTPAGFVLDRAQNVSMRNTIVGVGN